jgi:carbonic anhydrase
VHHTDCGLEGTSNRDLARQTGLSGVDFLPFSNASASVRTDVGMLRATAVLPPGTVVWGAVYDVETALLTRVIGPIGRALP